MTLRHVAFIACVLVGILISLRTTTAAGVDCSGECLCGPPIPGGIVFDPEDTTLESCACSYLVLIHCYEHPILVSQDAGTGARLFLPNQGMLSADPNASIQLTLTGGEEGAILPFIDTGYGGPNHLSFTLPLQWETEQGLDGWVPVPGTFAPVVLFSVGTDIYDLSLGVNDFDINENILSVTIPIEMFKRYLQQDAFTRGEITLGITMFNSISKTILETSNVFQYLFPSKTTLHLFFIPEFLYESIRCPLTMFEMLIINGKPNPQTQHEMSLAYCRWGGLEKFQKEDVFYNDPYSTCTVGFSNVIMDTQITRRDAQTFSEMYESAMVTIEAPYIFPSLGSSLEWVVSLDEDTQQCAGLAILNAHLDLNEIQPLGGSLSWSGLSTLNGINQHMNVHVNVISNNYRLDHINACLSLAGGPNKDPLAPNQYDNMMECRFPIGQPTVVFSNEIDMQVWAFQLPVDEILGAISSLNQNQWFVSLKLAYNTGPGTFHPLITIDDVFSIIPDCYHPQHYADGSCGENAEEGSQDIEHTYADGTSCAQMCETATDPDTLPSDLLEIIGQPSHPLVVKMTMKSEDNCNNLPNAACCSEFTCSEPISYGECTSAIDWSVFPTTGYFECCPTPDPNPLYDAWDRELAHYCQCQHPSMPLSIAFQFECCSHDGYGDTTNFCVNKYPHDFCICSVYNGDDPVEEIPCLCNTCMDMTGRPFFPSEEMTRGWILQRNVKTPGNIDILYQNYSSREYPPVLTCDAQPMNVFPIIPRLATVTRDGIETHISLTDHQLVMQRFNTLTMTNFKDPVDDPIILSAVQIEYEGVTQHVLAGAVLLPFSLVDHILYDYNSPPQHDDIVAAVSGSVSLVFVDHLTELSIEDIEPKIVDIILLKHSRHIIASFTGIVSTPDLLSKLYHVKLSLRASTGTGPVVTQVSSTKFHLMPVYTLDDVAVCKPHLLGHDPCSIRDPGQPLSFEPISNGDVPPPPLSNDFIPNLMEFIAQHDPMDSYPADITQWCAGNEIESCHTPVSEMSGGTYISSTIISRDFITTESPLKYEQSKLGVQQLPSQYLVIYRATRIDTDVHHVLAGIGNVAVYDDNTNVYSQYSPCPSLIDESIGQNPVFDMECHNRLRQSRYHQIFPNTNTDESRVFAGRRVTFKLSFSGIFDNLQVVAGDTTLFSGNIPEPGTITMGQRTHDTRINPRELIPQNSQTWDHSPSVFVGIDLIAARSDGWPPIKLFSLGSVVVQHECMDYTRFSDLRALEDYCYQSDVSTRSGVCTRLCVMVANITSPVYPKYVPTETDGEAQICKNDIVTVLHPDHPLSLACLSLNKRWDHPEDVPAMYEGLNMYSSFESYIVSRKPNNDEEEEPEEATPWETYIDQCVNPMLPLGLRANTLAYLFNDYNNQHVNIDHPYTSSASPAFEHLYHSYLRHGDQSPPPAPINVPQCCSAVGQLHFMNDICTCLTQLTSKHQVHSANQICCRAQYVFDDARNRFDYMLHPALYTEQGYNQCAAIVTRSLGSTNPDEPEPSTCAGSIDLCPGFNEDINGLVPYADTSSGRMYLFRPSKDDDVDGIQTTAITPPHIRITTDRTGSYTPISGSQLHIYHADEILAQLTVLLTTADFGFLPFDRRERFSHLRHRYDAAAHTVSHTEFITLSLTGISVVPTDGDDVVALPLGPITRIKDSFEHFGIAYDYSKLTTTRDIPAFKIPVHYIADENNMYIRDHSHFQAQFDFALPQDILSQFENDFFTSISTTPESISIRFQFHFTLTANNDDNTSLPLTINSIPVTLRPSQEQPPVCTPTMASNEACSPVNIPVLTECVTRGDQHFGDVYQVNDMTLDPDYPCENSPPVGETGTFMLRHVYPRHDAFSHPVRFATQMSYGYHVNIDPNNNTDDPESIRQYTLATLQLIPQTTRFLPPSPIVDLTKVDSFAEYTLYVDERYLLTIQYISPTSASVDLNDMYIRISSKYDMSDFCTSDNLGIAHHSQDAIIPHLFTLTVPFHCHQGGSIDDETFTRVVFPKRQDDSEPWLPLPVNAVVFGSCLNPYKMTSRADVMSYCQPILFDTGNDTGNPDSYFYGDSVCVKLCQALLTVESTGESDPIITLNMDSSILTQTIYDYISRSIRAPHPLSELNVNEVDNYTKCLSPQYPSDSNDCVFYTQFNPVTDCVQSSFAQMTNTITGFNSNDDFDNIDNTWTNNIDRLQTTSYWYYLECKCSNTTSHDPECCEYSQYLRNGLPSYCQSLPSPLTAADCQDEHLSQYTACKQLTQLTDFYNGSNPDHSSSVACPPPESMSYSHPDTRTATLEHRRQWKPVYLHDFCRIQHTLLSNADDLNDMKIATTCTYLDSQALFAEDDDDEETPPPTGVNVYAQWYYQQLLWGPVFPNPTHHHDHQAWLNSNVLKSLVNTDIWTRKLVDDCLCPSSSGVMDHQYCCSTKHDPLPGGVERYLQSTYGNLLCFELSSCTITTSDGVITLPCELSCGEEGEGQESSPPPSDDMLKDVIVQYKRLGQKTKFYYYSSSTNTCHMWEWDSLKLSVPTPFTDGEWVNETNEASQPLLLQVNQSQLNGIDPFTFSVTISTSDSIPQWFTDANPTTTTPVCDMVLRAHGADELYGLNQNSPIDLVGQSGTSVFTIPPVNSPSVMPFPVTVYLRCVSSDPQAQQEGDQQIQSSYQVAEFLYKPMLVSSKCGIMDDLTCCMPNHPMYEVWTNVNQPVNFEASSEYSTALALCNEYSYFTDSLDHFSSECVRQSPLFLNPDLQSLCTLCGFTENMDMEAERTVSKECCGQLNLGSHEVSGIRDICRSNCQVSGLLCSPHSVCDETGPFTSAMECECEPGFFEAPTCQYGVYTNSILYESTVEHSSPIEYDIIPDLGATTVTPVGDEPVDISQFSIIHFVMYSPYRIDDIQSMTIAVVPVTGAEGSEPMVTLPVLRHVAMDANNQSDHFNKLVVAFTLNDLREHYPISFLTDLDEQLFSFQVRLTIDYVSVSYNILKQFKYDNGCQWCPTGNFRYCPLNPDHTPYPGRCIFFQGYRCLIRSPTSVINDKVVPCDYDPRFDRISTRYNACEVDTFTHSRGVQQWDFASEAETTPQPGDAPPPYETTTCTAESLQDAVEARNHLTIGYYCGVYDQSSSTIELTPSTFNENMRDRTLDTLSESSCNLQQYAPLCSDGGAIIVPPPPVFGVISIDDTYADNIYKYTFRRIDENSPGDLISLADDHTPPLTASHQCIREGILSIEMNDYGYKMTIQTPSDLRKSMSKITMTIIDSFGQSVGALFNDDGQTMSIIEATSPTEDIELFWYRPTHLPLFPPDSWYLVRMDVFTPSGAECSSSQPEKCVYDYSSSSWTAPHATSLPYPDRGISSPIDECKSKPNGFFYQHISSYNLNPAYEPVSTDITDPPEPHTWDPFAQQCRCLPSFYGDNCEATSHDGHVLNLPYRFSDPDIKQSDRHQTQFVHRCRRFSGLNCGDKGVIVSAPVVENDVIVGLTCSCACRTGAGPSAVVLEGNIRLNYDAYANDNHHPETFLCQDCRLECPDGLVPDSTCSACICDSELCQTTHLSTTLTFNYNHYNTTTTETRTKRYGYVYSDTQQYIASMLLKSVLSMHLLRDNHLVSRSGGSLDGSSNEANTLAIAVHPLVNGPVTSSYVVTMYTRHATPVKQHPMYASAIDAWRQLVEDVNNIVDPVGLTQYDYQSSTKFTFGRLFSSSNRYIATNNWVQHPISSQESYRVLCQQQPQQQSDGSTPVPPITACPVSLTYLSPKYWSSCVSDEDEDEPIRFRSLSPVCYDFLGIAQPQELCARDLFPGFPVVSQMQCAVQCDNGNTPDTNGNGQCTQGPSLTMLTSRFVTRSDHRDGPLGPHVTPRDLIRVQWVYQGDLTNSVVIYLEQDKSHTWYQDNNGQELTYPLVLATVPAVAQTVVVQLPETLFTPPVGSPLLEQRSYDALYLSARVNRGTPHAPVDTRASELPEDQFGFFTGIPSPCMQACSQVGQYCTPSGQCQCRPGYIDTKTRDGVAMCLAHCEQTPCQHGGICRPGSLNTETNTWTVPLCECPPPTSLVEYSGTYCESVKRISCNPQKQSLSDPQLSMNECEMGYYPPSGSTGCSSTCQCNGNWRINPASGYCNVCALDMTKYTRQIDNTNPYSTADSLLEQCYARGTNSTRTSRFSNNCQRCRCIPGYTGEQCHQRSAFGVISFIKNSIDTILDDINPLVDILRHVPAAILQRLASDVATSLGLPRSQVAIIQVTQKVTTTTANTEQLTTMFGIQIISVMNHPVSHAINGNEFLLTAIIMDPQVDLKLSKKLQYEQYIDQHPQQATETNGDTLDDLYGMWEQLRRDFGNTPIAQSPIQDEFGSVEPLPPMYDPNCLVGTNPECPTGEDFLLPTYDNEEGDEEAFVFPDPDNTSGKRNTNVIIIVVVCVVVGSLALIIGISVAVRYCQKNGKACFSKKSKAKKSAENTSQSGTSASSSNTNGKTSGRQRPRGTTQSEKSGSGTEMTSLSGNIVPTVVEDETLPPGWKALTDPQGKVYFFNSDTMQTTWKHPNAQDDSEDEEVNEYGW